MFPLGSVLFPHMPVVLRVFEERYLVMLARILDREPSEFGIVLIERGQEVGGGERRFTCGTVAQVTQLESGEGFVALVAEGDRRLEVVRWLDDDPHPVAEIRELPALQWDDALEPLRQQAEHVVRRTLAMASEFSDQQWSASVELSDEPIESIWQLAGIAPLGSLDQVALLSSTSAEELLERTIDLCLAAAETLGTWEDENELDGFDPDELN